LRLNLKPGERYRHPGLLVNIPIEREAHLHVSVKFFNIYFAVT